MAQQKWLESTMSQTRGKGRGKAQQMVSYDLIFHLFPTFSPLLHGPKIARLNKIEISTRKYSLSEGNSIPRSKHFLVQILLDTMNESPVWLKTITNNLFSIPRPDMVVLFLLVPTLWQENVKIMRGKGYRHQLRTFKHKGKHKIVCYPKSILIFTA